MAFLFGLQDTLLDFFEKGGGVVLFIGLLIILMWSFILERFWYFKYIHSDVENDIDNQESNLTSLLNENRERLDIISFTTNKIFENTGYGFLSINKVYTEYLDQEVSHKMYLTNRTLPKYLKVQYLSDSFGTGRYFLTYEIVNIQNNFLFNFFSIGMFYLILNVFVIIFSFQKNFSHGLKVSLLLISIGLGSMEDLLPLFGLYLSLMFTMELNES